MKPLHAIAYLFFTTLALACSAPPGQKVPLPDQSIEITSPEVARVYVMRRGQGRGALRSIRVYDEAVEIGAFDQGQYLCWERRPGRGLIRIVYEGANIDGGDRESQFDLLAQPGVVYFIGVGVDRNRNKPQVGAIMEERAREFLSRLKTP